MGGPLWLVDDASAFFRTELPQNPELTRKECVNDDRVYQLWF